MRYVYGATKYMCKRAPPLSAARGWAGAVGRLLTRFTTGEVPGRAGHDLAHYALLCSWPSTAL